VAVRNLAGEPRAALSVAMPLERWSEAAEEQAACVLKSAAVALGAHLSSSAR
jgi:DNA-binding IclR family transcriptional regulator